MKAKQQELMTSPISYLLGCIVKYKTEYKSFGTLDGKYIDDVAKAMKNFAEETVLNVIDRLNKGYEVKIKDQIVSIKKPKNPQP